MRPCLFLTTALALALAACSQPKPDLDIPRDAPLSAYVTRPPIQAEPARPPYEQTDRALEGRAADEAAMPTFGVDHVVQSVPAPQWITGCIQTMTGPTAQQAAALAGNGPPTYAGNRTWCIREWNTLHPDQKIEGAP